MGRLEELSIELAYKLNDSRQFGSNGLITVATQNGNRFSAARRLAALNYAVKQIDKFSRMNIATAVQNPLSFQSPFRIVTYYLSTVPSTVKRTDIQQVLRLEHTPLPSEPEQKFRQVMADVLDEYRTVGYTTRDVYPDGVFTISTSIVNNGTPSVTAFNYRAFVRRVDAISIQAFPKVKYVPVSARVFDDMQRGVRSAESEEALKQFVGIYSETGSFLNGKFTPTSTNFTGARVYETVLFRSETDPTAEFVKVPMDTLRDIQNRVFSETLFESLKSMVGFRKVQGTLQDDKFVPNDPLFDFRYVKEVTGFSGNPPFKALLVSWDVVDNLTHGIRPTFITDYKTAYGHYTTTGTIQNGVLNFDDPNIQYFSHIADIVGIKSVGLYESGGEKFRKVSMEVLREYQNGTAVLQNPSVLPDGRTDDYLFACNDTGVYFYPPTVSAQNLAIEYLGIPPSKLFAYRQGSFIYFPYSPITDPPAQAEISYFGFSPSTIFYAESMRDDIDINVYPPTYSGDVTITYRGLPMTIEVFVADSDRIRLTGTGGLGTMTYTGKPPAFVYAFRDGIIETFPPLSLFFTVNNQPSSYLATVQRSHPTLAYNSQDLEYPVELDSVVLDIAMGYLYEENGDFQEAQAMYARGKQSLAEWIGVSQVAVGLDKPITQQNQSNGNQ